MVILQNGELHQLDSRVVAVIFSSPKYAKYKGNVALKKGVAGLDCDSWVLCHQIYTVSLDRFRDKKGKLDPDLMNEIQNAVSYCLRIPQ